MIIQRYVVTVDFVQIMYVNREQNEPTHLRAHKTQSIEGIIFGL